MPDCPLLVDEKTWSRATRAFEKLFEAQDADTKTKPRLLMLALVYAKREYTYQVDAITFMLMTDNWIPIEGTHEVELLQALTEQERRFIKPLRYDAKRAEHFPNVLLLDTGERPTPLYAVGRTTRRKPPRKRHSKSAAIHRGCGTRTRGCHRFPRRGASGPPLPTQVANMMMAQPPWMCQKCRGTRNIWPWTSSRVLEPLPRGLSLREFRIHFSMRQRIDSDRFW
jgi:hypothetical protein